MTVSCFSLLNISRVTLEEEEEETRRLTRETLVTSFCRIGAEEAGGGCLEAVEELVGEGEQEDEGMAG
jgi:hypothetical protein